MGKLKKLSKLIIAGAVAAAGFVQWDQVASAVSSAAAHHPKLAVVGVAASLIAALFHQPKADQPAQ